MPRNKPRLQLALYSRPKHPRTYHYALFIGAKSAQGPVTKHHVKNTLQIDVIGEATSPWRYEQIAVPHVEFEQRLLVCVVIAKVLKPGDVAKRALESVPVHQRDEADRNDSESFTCRTWVRDALQALREQGVVSAELGGWDEIQQMALEYVDRKREQKRRDSG